MTMHPDWTALNDYADDMLAPAERAGVDEHLARCASCRGSIERLASLRARARALPATLPVPEQSWDAVRAQIDRTKVVPLGVTPAAAVPRAPWTTRAFGAGASRARFVAAAALLVTASSAATAWFINRDPGVPAALGGADTVRGHSPALVIPASVAGVERDYTETIAHLSAVLDAARAKLAPETVRSIERNLQIVDDAIAEARAALLGDPASEALRDLLTRNYRQKVDLLRRASSHVETS